VTETRTEFVLRSNSNDKCMLKVEVGNLLWRCLHGSVCKHGSGSWWAWANTCPTLQRSDRLTFSHTTLHVSYFAACWEAGHSLR